MEESVGTGPGIASAFARSLDIEEVGHVSNVPVFPGDLALRATACSQAVLGHETMVVIDIMGRISREQVRWFAAYYLLTGMAPTRDSSG